MDPDANLREQRQIAADILATWDACADDGMLTTAQAAHVAHEAHRLAELVEALDTWITGNGHHPADWDKGRQTIIGHGDG